MFPYRATWPVQCDNRMPWMVVTALVIWWRARRKTTSRLGTHIIHKLCHITCPQLGWRDQQILLMQWPWLLAALLTTWLLTQAAVSIITAMQIKWGTSWTLTRYQLGFYEQIFVRLTRTRHRHLSGVFLLGIMLLCFASFFPLFFTHPSGVIIF